MKNAREQLIEELKNLPTTGNTYASTYLLGSTLSPSRIEQLADFIIKDRARVVGPCKNILICNSLNSARSFARETLKNAGSE